MVYEDHQPNTSKNSDRLSVLSKLEDKYSYDSVNFPVSYTNIKTFDEPNSVCIMV